MCAHESPLTMQLLLLQVRLLFLLPLGSFRRRVQVVLRHIQADRPQIHKHNCTVTQKFDPVSGEDVGILPRTVVHSIVNNNIHNNYSISIWASDNYLIRKRATDRKPKAKGHQFVTVRIRLTVLVYGTTSKD